MKKFMDKDFLLTNKTAARLYHEYAASEPIFDYHCHLIPREIADNRRFDGITEAWLGSNGYGDHYKWRMMRANGVSEAIVTGPDADPYEKFLAWAGTMERLIGNPLYHWTHLELQRYFDIDEPLTTSSAPAIYKAANEKLASDPFFCVSGIMKKFNVYAVGTTDDPIDDLADHKRILDMKDSPAKVLPSFRPDKALNIEQEGFCAYIQKLGNSTGIDIQTAGDVIKALIKRLDFFVSLGCKASDHALTYPPFVMKSDAEVNAIFQRSLEGERLSQEEVDAYKTRVLLALGRAYHDRNIAMQLHLSAIRNVNSRQFAKLGPDTGYDAVHDPAVSFAANLSRFLDELEKTRQTPKTILYSLNQNDYEVLMTVGGGFQGNVPGKIQLGSAWWFCDHKDGMEYQMKSLANIGLLSRFVGMLTDSRSFLSYPRHEYFRRILCNIIGTWVEDGEVNGDFNLLGGIVRDISFGNAQTYFEG
ncbi:glucuronate isomerase [Parasphaerochaeta coccoides]|uniref:Uronate isomerase n=1 Tax=Parasphaerochaeta coccoides (strain ATCC BAA-1237 / DSM 17374 / SPN1) TaxID=760011 RepID=F4GIZ3_PARC1|nr:glucuronate isomerase [Parasphaerochaeta coccoides]AEC01288.1 D-glucuronate isomerase [Parasphaerochaeta coccoides DSM 17374]